MAETEDVAESSVASASDNPPNQLERKIIRQIEVSGRIQRADFHATVTCVDRIQFYFGDRNLPRDNFLQEKIKEDEGCE